MPTKTIRSSALASIATAAALVLAGCSSTPSAPDTSMPPPVDCGAAALSGKVGQSVVGSTAQDVRVGGEPINVPGSIRVIHPGMAVTQDFRADRLNLEVGENGTLRRAYCA